VGQFDLASADLALQNRARVAPDPRVKFGMIMIRADFIRVFEGDSRIRRYRARFCNGRWSLVYQTDPVPLDWLQFALLVI